MARVRVTSKGQATLPKSMREQVGIRAPGEVLVHVEEGRLVVEPVLSVRQMQGVLRNTLRPGETARSILEELDEAERRGERSPKGRRGAGA